MRVELPEKIVEYRPSVVKLAEYEYTLNSSMPTIKVNISEVTGREGAYYASITLQGEGYLKVTYIDEKGATAGYIVQLSDLGWPRETLNIPFMVSAACGEKPAWPKGC
ncbi:hypothetical protein [Hyperthermus butylicus]|uniref:Uncharacterized protein n=1 Tax=Hyperthermus butylicus (strain DSM 5456 / JCM 9403 / PLM1-5) TaxID=415426 RepID=A2BMS0_HYPBU|nr:hypothetical protein [Hyperthermus butylicus]ABM81281.1 hypothetical protein Hbut_1457 [Hyperthermus butylicus DSM 5456]